MIASLTIITVMYLFSSEFFSLGNSDEVDEYIQLVTDEFRKAESFVLPKNNEAFYDGNTNTDTKDFGQYDFIVVGAGSAGAIVARRLSDRRFKVLLIEAGKNESKANDIPRLWNLNHNSEYKWGYFTKPQKYICLGKPNKQYHYVRGKLLGGSSAVNAGIYSRGSSHDQDDWSLYGVTGWSWNDVLPFYKKLENFVNINGDPGYHGYSGPVPFEYSKPPHILLRRFLQAYDEMADLTSDYNGQNQIGAGEVQFNKINGRRASTNKCYLHESNPKYLTILTQAYAYKIITRNKRAVGVEFIKDKVRYAAYNRLEVIVSAGVINSPQLLLLSGIGPKEELQKHNIPIVSKLPVGQNFQDHLGVIIQFKVNYPLCDRSLESDVWDFLHGSGHLASSNSFGLAYHSTVGNTTYFDIEALFWVDNIDSKLYNFSNPRIPRTNLVVKEQNCSIIIMALHTKSRGEITLKSNNPKDYPDIDLITHFDKSDFDVIYKGIQHVLRLLKTETFSKLNATLVQMDAPACNNLEYLSRVYWICVIEQCGIATLHGAGTCRMGSDKESSVLDSKLRVRGVRDLRVIDMSSVPRTNSGHANAVAMMMGEKGSDVIIKDYSFGFA